MGVKVLKVNPGSTGLSGLFLRVRRVAANTSVRLGHYGSLLGVNDGGTVILPSLFESRFASGIELNIENTNCLVILIHDRDVKWRGLYSVIGTAVAMDKPIVLACPPGVAIPHKLSRVVDRFVEWDADSAKLNLALSVALQAIGIGDRNCQCEFCQRVRSEVSNEQA